MKDPGYIPARGWLQESPYMDKYAFDYDADEVLNDEALLAERNILEPRSTWLHRTIADRRRREREDLEAARAAQPTGVADRSVTHHPTPAGVRALAGVSSPS